MEFKTKRKFRIMGFYRPKIYKNEFEEMMRKYDQLYSQACAIIKAYDPCQIKNGECFAKIPCCCGCEFLSKRTGCMAKSLACKLYLCEKAREKFPECAAELDKIEAAARKDRRIILGFRTIKEDAFYHYEIVDK